MTYSYLRVNVAIEKRCIAVNCYNKEKRLEMIIKIMLLSIASLMLVSVSGMAEQSDKDKVTVLAAEKWLSIVDEGKYGKSWNESAEYFRNGIKQEKWERSTQAVRTMLGKLLSRKVKSTSYKTSLPGAPDGQYLVIVFETSFENKKSAIETVTMINNGGKWRVSGYSIVDDKDNKNENNRTVGILLFPINLAPDIVTNTILFLFNPLASMAAGKSVSNIWPIISFVSPVMGPVTGAMDAWYGYPFWNPIALDEHRKY